MDRVEIESWLKKYEIKNYTINEDLSIDVAGSVDLNGLLGVLKVLPVKFRNVVGGFNCNFNALKNLVGCPTSVGRYFYCDNNQLTSLEGCPTSIGGEFSCYNNRITSLEGCPEILPSNLYCGHNRLKNLIGGPISVGGNYSCYNNKLTSLEGCLQDVGGFFDCSGGDLVKLDCIFKVSGYFNCANNKLSSLEGCPTVVGSFTCMGNKLIESELFLYDCSIEQVNKYYRNKKLSIDLLEGLEEVSVIEIKKNKI